MNDPTRPARRAALCLALAGLASGCLSRSPQVRTFTLGATPRAVDAALASDIAVQIGPARFPRYVERPQVVRRIEGGELELDEGHRWADSFEGNVLRALRLDVERRLGSNRVVDHESGPTFPLDHRVRIDFDEFVCGPGDVLRMRARWSIEPTGDGETVVGRTDRDIPVDGGSIEAQVAAHERAVAALGEEIAAAIAALQR